MRNPKADKYLMCCSFTNGTRSTSQKRIQLFAKLIKNPALFFLPCLKVSYICWQLEKVNLFLNIYPWRISNPSSSNILRKYHEIIEFIHKVTLSLGLLSPPLPPYPLFQRYPQSKEILLNLSMKWWNSAFDAQSNWKVSNYRSCSTGRSSQNIVVTRTWVLSLCSSSTPLLGALFNGACQGFF